MTVHADEFMLFVAVSDLTLYILTIGIHVPVSHILNSHEKKQTGNASMAVKVLLETTNNNSESQLVW